MTNPDGGVTQYAYDERNRMVSLINPFTETTAWTCDAGGRVTRIGYENGAYTLYGYDDAGQVLSIQHCSRTGHRSGAWRTVTTRQETGHNSPKAMEA
jgi:YD repeat-containing protein